MTAAVFAAVLLSGCDALDDGSPRRDFQTSTANYSPPRRIVTRLRAAPVSTTPDYAASDTTTPTPDPNNNDTMDSSPKMPTLHSHWLRGTVSGARVGVKVNGVSLGDISGPIDRDITMICRDGANTIAFTYTPSGAGAAQADFRVLESEHDVPVPPLVSFRRGGISSVSSASESALGARRNPSVQPETETFAFTAH